MKRCGRLSANSAKSTQAAGRTHEAHWVFWRSDAVAGAYCGGNDQPQARLVGENYRNFSWQVFDRLPAFFGRADALYRNAGHSI